MKSDPQSKKSCLTFKLKKTPHLQKKFLSLKKTWSPLKYRAVLHKVNMVFKQGFKQDKYGFIKNKDLASIQWKTGFALKKKITLKT